MTLNAERKINNPDSTKKFKSNNFNLGDTCPLKLINISKIFQYKIIKEKVHELQRR